MANNSEQHDVEIEKPEIEEAKDDALYVEELPDQTDLAVAAGTWTSVSSFTSASCPVSTAGSIGTASSVSAA